MADGRVVHPSIFVVDSGIGFPPPLLPKPGEKRIQKRRKHLIQKTLSVLVCLALLGLLVEAFFIYSLHHTNQTTESVSENFVLSIMASSLLTFLSQFC